MLKNNKWKLLIMRNLFVRPWRFNELHRSLEGISQKVLTDNLRAMEADGLIIRKDYNEVPISLSANKGKIAAVEYLWEDNQKIYDVIKAEIDDDGQLQVDASHPGGGQFPGDRGDAVYGRT